MKSFSIYMYSSKSTPVLKINGNGASIDNIVLELLAIFEPIIDQENFSIKINPIQKRTETLAQKVSEFVDKYKSIIPQINRFNSFIKKLDNDESFFIMPGVEKLSDEQIISIGNFLLCANQNRPDDFEKMLSDKQDIFGELLENYKLIVVDKDTKHYIGKRAKKNRICRFCGETDPQKFNSVAHAISEALGNKNVILHDECDTCNAYFAQSIESDIITYLSLYRTFFGIKNKSNNIPKIKGKNFEYINMGDKSLILKFYSEDQTGCSEMPKTVPLKFYDKITLQNIYKALSKYALSIIPIEYFSNFDKTVEWIRNDVFEDRLPKVGIKKSYGNFFSELPNLTVYIRKNGNKNIPYAVGEFHFTFLIFVFIIPIFDDDEKKFIETDEYDSFLNCFKHYQNMENWSFENFPNCENKEVIFNMNFEQRNN